MVDPIMSDHLSDLMLRLKKNLGPTSIVVTHDLDLMYKVADQVVFLFEGRVIFFGPPADLAKPDRPHVREFLEMDRVAYLGFEVQAVCVFGQSKPKLLDLKAYRLRCPRQAGPGYVRTESRSFSISCYISLHSVALCGF